MEKPRKTKSKVAKKLKTVAKTTISVPKQLKLNDPNQLILIEKKIEVLPLKPVDIKELGDRFPILKNEELIKRFLSVPMTNNQKGRIRQMLRDNLKGTSDTLLPEIINNKIQAILKTPNLIDSDLRKIRILYNMLLTALKHCNIERKKVKKPIKDSEKPEVSKINNSVEVSTEKKKDGSAATTEKKKLTESNENKQKGPKRYVVFLGNLPLEINKEKILNHFSEMSDHIKDVRIPKRGEEKKSAIAYVELSNEPAFEFALSKHHSMLGNRRINVLYTIQKNSKISKATAKSKSAKLLALQKSGVLLGSTPMNRRRSQRRKKMKEALAKQQNS